MAILEVLVPPRKKEQSLRVDLPLVLAAGGAEEVASLPLEEVEHRCIARLLAAAGRHISNAAKVLRIMRGTLDEKMQKDGLTP